MNGYQTQMEAARRGIVTPELRAVARDEGVSEEFLLSRVAAGTVAIPANVRHTARKSAGVGEGLRTKINVNLGVSGDCRDYAAEMRKAELAVRFGAEAIMDLSNYGKTHDFRRALIERSSAMIGTVPMYDAVGYFDRDLFALKAQDFLQVVRAHAEEGVDFMTIHAGLNRRAVEAFRRAGREMNVVSRGGSLLFAWMEMTGNENPFFEYYDDVLDILREYDVTISLGDALRPGCLKDASDAGQIAMWPTIKKHLTAGKALYFSHGFGITYKDRTGIVPPADVDVIMIAPKGSGTSLRRMFLQGRGLNSSYAVFQDATGRAKDRVIALGIGVGSGYLFETTFKKEVYSDLTGERGTLMGAIQGIFAAQYDTLRENGHTPSEAFNETVEELSQSLMPLIAENGMDWMYANCSTTAQRGALDWWKKFRDATKPVFEELYREVAAGNEAQRSIDSNSQPDYREKLNKELEEMHNSEMWRAGAVGRKLRPENN